MLIGHTFEFDLDYGRSVGAGAKVIQCNRDADAIGRNRRVDFGFACRAALLLDALAAMSFAAVDRAWVDGLTNAWRQERAAQLESPGQTPLHPVEAIDAVIDAMPPNTLFVTSHGNVDFWADARIRVRGPGTYLRAGQAGALGAEIPYGVGASFVRPASPVVVFVGDGGVGYHITELETALRYGRQVIVVVLDDEKWAAIALPQRDAYGDEYEMDLPRRDWGMVALGLGGYGASAGTEEGIKTALRAAFASGKAGLVQVPVRAVLSPYMAYISR
jgi:acetolactate synthase-1/2/3 large subunit